MFEDRKDVAEADEDGGGRNEKYEINSMGEPARAERLLLRLRCYRNIREQRINARHWS